MILTSKALLVQRTAQKAILNVQPLAAFTTNKKRTTISRVRYLSSSSSSNMLSISHRSQSDERIEKNNTKNSVSELGSEKPQILTTMEDKTSFFSNSINHNIVSCSDKNGDEFIHANDSCEPLTLSSYSDLDNKFRMSASSSNSSFIERSRRPSAFSVIIGEENTIPSEKKPIGLSPSITQSLKPNASSAPLSRLSLRKMTEFQELTHMQSGTQAASFISKNNSDIKKNICQNQASTVIFDVRK